MVYIESTNVGDKKVCDKLTIYLTTYNRADYLRESVNSLLNQSYKNYKLIILDNCSTDNTKEIVKSFLVDKRVQYIRHKENIGGANNINYAFSNCNTEYFCVFHDDDILHNNLLEKEVDFMDRNPNCAAASCLANIIDENGMITRTAKFKKQLRIFERDSFFKEYLYQQRHLIFPTTIYRSSFIKRHNVRLNHEVGPCADVVLYMDIERHGGMIVELNEVLFNYRVYLNQDSSINLEKMLVQLINFLKCDEYYSKLMKTNHMGEKKYFNWYARLLMKRAASGVVSADTEKIFLIRMKEMLNGSSLFFLLTKIVLCLEETMPSLFNAIYKIVKGIKL